MAVLTANARTRCGEPRAARARNTPVHELLARIRRDRGFVRSRFVIGYWDRVERKVMYVGLREIAWDVDAPAFFDLLDEEAFCTASRFDRVREVWRDGGLIWRRYPAGEGA